jgi:hypothetical protein
VELVHGHAADVRVLAKRSASWARISAVQQMTGASLFITTSPVIMPTLSLPRRSTRLKNFSLTSAFMGAV